ncbi:hypothetical protein LQ764DRAFT_233747 [Zygosaccharomyces rouxii]|nr:hypothetical protein LQ764DRAFT_233747 [Zygosaccharomyces rouxii]
MSLNYYRCFYPFMDPQMATMQAMEFLAIITNVGPGKELDKWDQITKYTNQYLTGGNSGHSRNVFFDGNHCLD